MIGLACSPRITQIDANFNGLQKETKTTKNKNVWTFLSFVIFCS